MPTPITTETLTNATELLKRKKKLASQIENHKVELAEVEDKIKSEIPAELLAFIDAASAVDTGKTSSGGNGTKSEGKKPTAQELIAMLEKADKKTISIRNHGIDTEHVKDLVKDNPSRLIYKKSAYPKVTLK